MGSIAHARMSEHTHPSERVELEIKYAHIVPWLICSLKALEQSIISPSELGGSVTANLSPEHMNKLVIVHAPQFELNEFL